MVDISGFMIWFVAEVVKLFIYVYSVLGSITFLGTSLLQFTLSLFIIGTILQILVISVRTRAVRETSKGNKKGKAKKNED